MLSWLAIVFCSIFLVKSLQRVIKGSFSTLHLAVIVFYAMQVAPLFVENIWGFDSHMLWIPNMHLASLDYWVHVIYCFFVCLTVLIFFFWGNYLKPDSENILPGLQKKFEINFFMLLFLVLGICSPFFTLIAAPDPSIYLIFARFYKIDFNEIDMPFIYHMVVVKHVVYVSFLSTILLYFFNDEKNRLYNLFVIFGVLTVTWFEGKRAFLIFALLAIIAIDIIRDRYQTQKGRFIAKNCVFLVVSFVFFIIYREYTGKNSDTEFLSQYNQYYSRMGVVKTAIYAIINEQPVLEYPGQSFLYDVFFFVPRGFWPNKPAMFVKYFTAYATNRKIVDFLPWNLIVNMWCEFIANFGIVGYLVGLGLTGLVAKITDFTSNVFVRMWGTIFILLYFMFGFEYLVLIVYVLFLFFFLYQKIKERL